MLKKAQPDVEFVTEQAPPLGRVEAGTVVQAIDDAKPDGIFNVLFGPDLAKLVREGTTRGTFKNRTVVEPALRRAGISRSAQGRGPGRLDRHRLSRGTRSTRRTTRPSSLPIRSAGTTIRGSARSSAMTR